MSTTITQEQLDERTDEIVQALFNSETVDSPHQGWHITDGEPTTEASEFACWRCGQHITIPETEAIDEQRSQDEQFLIFQLCPYCSRIIMDRYVDAVLVDLCNIAVDARDEIENVIRAIGGSDKAPPALLAAFSSFGAVVSHTSQHLDGR